MWQRGVESGGGGSCRNGQNVTKNAALSCSAHLCVLLKILEWYSASLPKTKSKTSSLTLGGEGPQMAGPR